MSVSSPVGFLACWMDGWVDGWQQTHRHLFHDVITPHPPTGGNCPSGTSCSVDGISCVPTRLPEIVTPFIDCSAVECGAVPTGTVDAFVCPSKCIGTEVCVENKCVEREYKPLVGWFGLVWVDYKLATSVGLFLSPSQPLFSRRPSTSFPHRIHTPQPGSQLPALTPINARTKWSAGPGPTRAATSSSVAAALTAATAALTTQSASQRSRRASPPSRAPQTASAASPAMGVSILRGSPHAVRAAHSNNSWVVLQPDSLQRTGTVSRIPCFQNRLNQRIRPHAGGDMIPCGNLALGGECATGVCNEEGTACELPPPLCTPFTCPATRQCGQV
jgi:hypothetical protein